MPFPIIMVLIILVGIAGSVAGPNNYNSGPEGEVIISTPSGGLARQAGRGSTVQPSQPSEPTENVEGESQIQREPTSEPVEEFELPPLVDTLTAQNIEQSRALLRGELTFPDAVYRGKAYFIYSREFVDVASESSNTIQILVSNYADENRIFFRTLSGLSDATTYYYRFCFEDTSVRCGDIVSFTTAEDFDRDSTFREPSVTTDSAINIDAGKTTLEGRYRRNDAANAIAFFVYGDDEDAVREIPSQYDEYQDIREFEERLQKKRVGVNIADRGEYSREVDDLERDTEYFFSLCIGYDDDEATGIKCGSIRSFETKSRQRDIPTIRATSASVSGKSAVLSANLSMRDYLDGYAFLTYGTDEEEIIVVADEDSFSRIRQDEDAIQKIGLETDFDGSDTFIRTIQDLLAGTSYYYRFCIEYETENDRGFDESTVTCGAVNTFTTQ